MMGPRTGLPPISTMGLGLIPVSSCKRVPSPPARIATLTHFLRGVSGVHDWPVAASGRPRGHSIRGRTSYREHGTGASWGGVSPMSPRDLVPHRDIGQAPVRLDVSALDRQGRSSP